MMNFARFGHAAAVHKNKSVVCGGRERVTAEPLRFCEYLTTGADHWYIMGVLPNGVELACMFSIGGKVCIDLRHFTPPF